MVVLYEMLTGNKSIRRFEPSEPSPLKRFIVPVPEGVILATGAGSLLSLRSDGTKLVFVGERDRVRRLYLHSWNQLASRELPAN